jgi:hypothetical protein
MSETPKQHLWYYTRQSFLHGGEQGPFTEQQMLELAKLGEIKLDTLLRSPTKTDNHEISAESIPKLAIAINQAEIDSKAKRLSDKGQRKREQNEIAFKKREAKTTKQELVLRKENEIEGYLEIPILRTQTPTSQHPVFPVASQARFSIDQPQKTGTQGFFHAFGITSGAIASIVAVVLGIPLLACGGCLGLAFLASPSAQVRNRMLIDQAAKNAEMNNVGTTVSQQENTDTRREWISESYGTIIAYKNESTWTDTYKTTGKLVSEMEFRGKTDDYIELFNLNPAARDLLRLYKDRMECKHPTGWVVIGSGHWDFADGNISVANQTVNEQKSETATKANPSEGKVSVLSTSIVSTGVGEFQAIEVFLRNDGPRPIRIADGVYHLFDQNGKSIEDINYGILFIEDDQKPVMPGETTKAGGFRIPKSMRVASAKVTLTKTLEKSSDSEEVPNTVLRQEDPLNNLGKITDSLHFIAKKIDTKNNSDEIFLYYTDGPIDEKKFKERCQYLKAITKAKAFSAIVVFDRKESARFPGNPISAHYGMDFEILKHIKLSYLYNKRNGYESR